MTPFPYRVIVRWSEPDDAYVAEVPAVRGAGGDGPTPEDAIRGAQESVAELLEVKKEHGDPIPPSDIEEAEFSGQIRLRMSRSLHRELAAAAERERVSLNHLMVEYLTRQLRVPLTISLPSSPNVEFLGAIRTVRWGAAMTGRITCAATETWSQVTVEPNVRLALPRLVSADTEAPKTDLPQ